MPKVALISGVLGQNGIFLARLLIGRGYTVHGICRTETLAAMTHAALPDGLSPVQYICSDAGDGSLVSRLPDGPIDEVYHFAERAFPATLDANPMLVRENVRAASNMLAILRLHPEAKLFWLGSSLQFGRHSTPYVRSKNVTYAKLKRVSRLEGLTVACCFSGNFYSRYAHPLSLANTIVRRLMRYAKHPKERPRFYNLNQVRSWGHAKDFVEAYPLILNGGNRGRDYRIVSGNVLTIGAFIRRAAEHLHLDASALLRADSPRYSPYVPSSSREDLIPVQSLGWKERSDTDELIASIIDRYR